MKTDNTSYKIAVGLAVAAAILLIWINLAVGIIGDPDDPANLMYVAVLAIGLVGAVIARFKPHGMSRVSMITAIAQALVPVIALGAGMHIDGRTPPIVIFLIWHGFFVAMFAGSAYLFGRAAREHINSK